MIALRITTSIVLAASATALVSGAAAAQSGATGRDKVRCSVNGAPEKPCLLTDTAVRGGYHRMVFTGQGVRVTFEGRSNSGWWAGKLNGRPAMGFERNRGSTEISTTDLNSRFSWRYPNS